MFTNLRTTLLRRAFAAAAGATAALLALASFGYAQTPAQTPQPTATPATRQEQQTQPPQPQEEAARAEATGNATGVRAAVAAAPAPLYGDYRGVKLGMTAAEVRSKLGGAEEKSDAMDFYVFSDTERARVYYRDGKASAIIATYIGAGAGALAPAAVLGEEIEAQADGSMYKMTPYPHAGYWVAYSRTAGDEPMVIITMQKTP
jgi:hypothetical protein